MAEGLQRVFQDDFSAGAYIDSSTPDRIPSNGLLGAENLLIDSQGGLYSRGGASYFPGSTWPSTPIVWAWEGLLAGGVKILAATETNLYLVGGGGVTLISAYTGMAGEAKRPAVLNGVMYLPGGYTYDGTTFGGPIGIGANYWAAVANRLVGVNADTAYFTAAGGAPSFDPTDFHKVPEGATSLGAAGIRDSLAWFTDRGMWVVSNMAYNLTDADGNVQQRLDLYAPELVLWGTGAAGVVGYGGGLIVPARDGVWLANLGVTSEVAAPLTLLSGPITEHYRALVQSGAKPGLATVYGGHYFLPVMFGGHSVEMLVCRLDATDRRGRRVFPWTSISGAASGHAMVNRTDGLTMFGSSGGSPATFRLEHKLFLDRSASPLDADGSSPGFLVTTRGIPTGPLSENTVAKLRATYAFGGVGSDTLEARYADGAMGSGGASSALSGAAPESGLLRRFTWPVGKRVRSARFSIGGNSVGFSLRSLEMFVRSSGRV